MLRGEAMIAARAGIGTTRERKRAWALVDAAVSSASGDAGDAAVGALVRAGAAAAGDVRSKAARLCAMAAIHRLAPATRAGRATVVDASASAPDAWPSLDRDVCLPGFADQIAAAHVAWPAVVGAALYEGVKATAARVARENGGTVLLTAADGIIVAVDYAAGGAAGSYEVRVQ
jgi:hypothetical protein